MQTKPIPMRTKPPGPKGEFVVGNARQYSKDPFAFLTACADAYGDVVRFDLGPLETYMLTNPDDIERVLVSDAAKYHKPDFQDEAMGELLGDGLLLSDGETWRSQRELANPAFNMSRIAGLDDLMVEKTSAMLEGWTAGETFDAQAELTRTTVDIIVNAMLGVDPTAEQVRVVRENLEPLGARFEPDPFRFLTPDWVPTRENRQYWRALAALEDVVDEFVAERRGTAGDGGDPNAPMDFLSILLRARERGEQTDEQLRDEMVTMLLAGHDTTALMLTYAWYLLARNPESEAKVHAEVDELDGPPTAADARRMSYAERVLQETMRLYPPVYTIFREPQVDVKLGGYRVPAGAGVMLPQWVVHRSPRYYEDPASFDPDRWLPERRSQRPQYAYFPFGGGPRHCIGRQFSMLEAKLIVGTVARNYRLEYAREEPFSLRGSLTMHPREPMEMRPVER